MTPQRSRRIRLNQDPVYRRRRLVAGLLSAALVVALLASIVAAWRSASTSARTAASSVTATLPVTATPGETAPPTEQATPTPTAASPTASPTPAHREPITITFAGDVHFEDQVRANLTNPSANLPALRDVLSERRPLEQLHDHEGSTLRGGVVVDDAHHAAMPDRVRDVALAQEPLLDVVGDREGVVQHLDGDAMAVAMGRRVDGGHAADAEHALEAILAELRAHATLAQRLQLAPFEIQCVPPQGKANGNSGGPDLARQALGSRDPGSLHRRAGVSRISDGPGDALSN